MPITTEEEPEDIDDDAPARVGLCHTSALLAADGQCPVGPAHY